MRAAIPGRGQTRGMLGGCKTDAAHSDSADNAFRFKGVEKRTFVRTGIGVVQCSNAFQAYDEGSIPFTRSNLFKDLSEREQKFETQLGCFFETFAPLSFSVRMRRRPLSRAASVLRTASMSTGA
jgi:hypothetical protein